MKVLCWLLNEYSFSTFIFHTTAHNIHSLIFQVIYKQGEFIYSHN